MTFSHGGDVVLSDVTLEIPKGKVIGLVGRSGSGKSTLLKLLMRFWNVQKGRVLVSGSDVSEINTGDLRDMESFVTQGTHLVHDSIRNNLRLAKLDSLNEAVILKSLNEQREDKTVVLVSHRKSTMRIADTVYSVESGRLS